jgi:D-3-phosphoglycerate dehydrogenase / 2-oxoglutarate reductase
MENFKVVITDCDHENVNIEHDILKNAGLDFELLQCKTEEDLINNCKGANGFINQYAPITERVLKELPSLKFVVRYGVGVNNVDINAATKYGVQVCNVPDYGMNEVADQALALMLALTRKITLMNELTKAGVWDFQKSIPVYRHGVQTVGIIGVGRIGSAFAKRVNALGCRVIGYDIAYGQKNRKYPEFVESVSLEELLKTSDVVSIHCPSDNAINLIGEEQFKMMKPSAYLINVSRGGIVNEKALDKALTEKWIAGAGLDVVEKEPLPKDSPLFKHKNIIVTPHMAWYSEESANELKRKVAEETVRFAKGEEVHYPINKIQQR